MNNLLDHHKVSGLVFYLSEFYVVTNTPFIGSVAATSGWPALIAWKAYNEDDRLFDFYFDTYRQARAPDEMDEVWLYIAKPGREESGSLIVQR